MLMTTDVLHLVFVKGQCSLQIDPSEDMIFEYVRVTDCITGIVSIYDNKEYAEKISQNKLVPMKRAKCHST